MSNVTSDIAVDEQHLGGGGLQFDNLYPVLLQTFVVIVLGYLKIFTDEFFAHIMTMSLTTLNDESFNLNVQLSQRAMGYYWPSGIQRIEYVCRKFRSALHHIYRFGWTGFQVKMAEKLLFFLSACVWKLLHTTCHCILSSNLSSFYSQVNWMFLGAILISKATVFIGVVIFTLLLTRPMDFSKAGLFAIFCTQSNDFALGYPIGTYQSITFLPIKFKMRKTIFSVILNWNE